MFNTLIVQPIHNLLVIIMAIIPGHSLGLAIIIFTLLIRLAMWPLIKKQLHHTQAMKRLQPEIKKIRDATKDDPEKTSDMILELYKEREIKPLASLWTIAVQVVVLIGLYSGIRHIADDPSVLVSQSYGWVQNLGWLNSLAGDIGNANLTLFGVFDLTRSAGGETGFYFPAFVLVIGAVVAQYFMGKQLLSEEDDARTLRQILKSRKDKSIQREKGPMKEVLDKSIKYIIPVFIFFFTYTLASALALYWMATGVIGYFQQARILDQDERELMTPKK